ncbi:8637_t:CDS:2 [Dentiscutata erythropus]|uniref:8637_t:CDS:1 n=1 Tax=Dentiscutata erythropus TaxID=1348616 RepID=A0A9N8Z904_9GLOM|nr:8637_t:CDS:2 [Dentiscutata erythropus]
MPVCVHKGCEKTYEEKDNHETACLYHPSAPIFHEGLKGWQCCSRRVTSFDEFLAIPGCTKGRHSNEVPPPTESNETSKESETVSSKLSIEPTVDKNGVEVYNSGPTYTPIQSKPAEPPQKAKPSPQEEKPEEEDDLSIPVAPGTVCKRASCNTAYVDDETSRNEGSQSECVYHPGTPIFHEGSKGSYGFVIGLLLVYISSVRYSSEIPYFLGWSCCSRKVLEFEEFLKIKGCKKGNHLFVGSSKKEEMEEIIECRHDWYQTPSYVIMSVFCKKIDKERSTISFKEKEMSINLRTADSKIFKEVFPLYQYIEPENSKYEFLSTKVEIKLKKANGISWPSLRADEDSGTATTFGVQGGNATVGGKEYILANDSPLYANQQIK